MAALASIVVPVFNGMPHLPATVTSALQQTYPNLEVVLVDGGSTDDSWTWMSSLDDPRVRIERLPRGTTAAENWTARAVLLCASSSEQWLEPIDPCRYANDFVGAAASSQPAAELQSSPETGQSVTAKVVSSFDPNCMLLTALRHVVYIRYLS